ncbi:mitochondrial translation initiation [Moniliophthora roreri MCA 2997]|uniref:Translation initiation factor IF-2, mitochondrial n=2 Tax=Moniliophthora roreri TaxID=221103 RepID=V2XGK1_MONRO|nr:mitochondrial translation initiation [Moniliophthora roreri MCA 2997]KAI3607945.1 mitochondrial translation initiation [Moniliophthora roreri]
MHRHRQVVPAVCRQCLQARKASTATKLKVEESTVSVSSSPRPNLSKWAPLKGNTLSGTKWDLARSNAPKKTAPVLSGTSSQNSSTRTNGNAPIDPFSSPSASSSKPSQSSLSAWREPSPKARSLQSHKIHRSQKFTGERIEFHRDRLPHEGVQDRPTIARENRMERKDKRQQQTQGQQIHTPSRATPPSQAQVAPAGRQLDAILEEGYADLRGEDEGLGNRRHKSKGKETRSRGSLVERMQHMGGSNPRTSNHPHLQTQKAKKSKKVVDKKVKVDVYIPSMVSVGALAQLLNVRLEYLQRRMKQSGLAEEASYDHVLTSDYAALLAEELGRNPVIDDEMAFDIYSSPQHPQPDTLPHRPPVVTIMGHVDHGKTTLLDTLRSTSVAKGEAGGITQHIGAFSVPVPANSGSNIGPRSITFLDTPGHAAFSAMRARGALVTDIIVLVVAADDGIMPQTREVINLIKQEQDKVGVVVVINKVDKPGANVENVQKSLLAEGIQLEAFGGDVPSVVASGLTRQGLPDLVETLSAIAEMQDLRAEAEGLVHGYVLESKIHKGLGAVATVLILRGNLTTGSHIISGTAQAKVRLMNDSAGKSVKSAGPGMAVTVSGWKTLPNAGDQVLQGSESDIKKAVANRQRKAEMQATLSDVEAINASRKHEREQRVSEARQEASGEETKEEAGPKELRLVVKADVSGSAEAVVGALHIGNHLAMTKVISSGVGDVTESDVMMAKTAGGMIVAFNVNVPRAMEVLAAQNNVPICSSGIIYRLIDAVKEHVIKLLPVIIEKKVTGEATVLQIFEIQLKSKQTIKVAGCRVTNGVVERKQRARVIRNGETIHEGPVETLRHLRKDVMEVRKGSECGLNLADFSDLEEGDFIQMFSTIEKPGVL